MSLAAGYIFKDGEAILAKKLNLAFSGSTSLVVPFGSTLSFTNTDGSLGPAMSNEAGAILCTQEIRMRGTNALFGGNNANLTDRFIASDIPGDTQNRFLVQISGYHAWGPGNATQDVAFGRLGAQRLYMAGASFGVRFDMNASGTAIEGVDSTGTGSFQPLILGGSTVKFAVSGTTVGTLTAAGIALDFNTATALPALIAPTTTQLRLGDIDAFGNIIQADSFGAGSAAINIVGRNAGGTRASPSATAANAIIYRLSAYGFDTALTTTQSGFYQTQADGLWSGSNKGVKHLWQGTPNGSTTAASWLLLDGTGLTITSGLDLKLGRARSAGAAVQGGTITILDSAGTTVTLLTT